ncbi:hypothetical protein [Pedobacter sp.]|uniref:hypothetical protein n=1 Tax=Pedobacter sp. TaxID=1411316 RepID=UPI0031D9D6FA
MKKQSKISAEKPNNTSAGLEKPRLRGSGYTYDEKAEPSDKSSPLGQDNADEALVLPPLGQKNRP